MSMNKIVFNVFFCIIFFLVSTVFSQVPQIKGGKTVKSGDNTVDWKGKLMGDKNIKLIATFDPGQKDFVPNSAYAISLNELQWNGNGQNSTKLARFNLTLPPKDFKNYPTYFSGYFQGKEKGGTEYDRWNASELLLFAPDEHTYYNITESQREIVDNNSGVCYNQTKIASDWNQYSVNKINPPLDYLPQKNDRFQNLRKVLSNHVTALAKQAGITNNASQGAYTVVQRSIPQVAWEKKETEKNLQCKGKDSNGNLPNPPCQKMERDYFMITVNVNLGAKIY
ncbi:MAG: hypothetical protein LBC20_10545, partial [Planctomycetaceae bacterium]|nr:hypothetical protein [Planctomycetaceae bacterium]